jgi:amidase
MAAAKLALFQKRLGALNPTFNAVITLADPRACLADAEAAAAARAAGAAGAEEDEDKDGLVGLPILVKEVIDVAGMATTLCDPSLASGFASALYTRARSGAQEAEVVTLLRGKGAMVLGKTNIPLKGLDVQCDNPVHGRTHNPWDAARTPGGSSGGSAAAVALGIVPLALGTDLGGSLRIPPAFCGVSSMRCSYGVVPTSGMQPPAAPAGDAEAPSSLQMGPIARDVRTLETFFKGTGLLDVMADAGAAPAAENAPALAISTGLGGVHVDARAARVLQPGSDSMGKLAAAGIRVVDANAQAGEFDMRSSGRCYGTYAKRYFIEQGGRSEQKHLDAADGLREGLREAVDGIIGDSDAWVLPVTPTGFAIAHNPTKGRVPVDTGDAEKGTAMVPYWQAMLPFVMPFTVTGHPVVTVPMGHVELDDGVGTVVPVGVQVVGRIGEDAKLLTTAKRIEDALWGKGVGPPAPPVAVASNEGDAALWR